MRGGYALPGCGRRASLAPACLSAAISPARAAGDPLHVAQDAPRVEKEGGKQIRRSDHPAGGCRGDGGTDGGTSHCAGGGKDATPCHQLHGDMARLPPMVCIVVGVVRPHVVLCHGSRSSRSMSTCAAPKQPFWIGLPGTAESRQNGVDAAAPPAPAAGRNRGRRPPRPLEGWIYYTFSLRRPCCVRFLRCRRRDRCLTARTAVWSWHPDGQRARRRAAGAAVTRREHPRPKTRRHRPVHASVREGCGEDPLQRPRQRSAAGRRPPIR